MKLIVLAAILLPLPGRAAFTQANAIRTLRAESNRAALAGSATRVEDAAAAAADGFDGGGVLPVTVQVLQPIETIDLPGQGSQQPSTRPGPAGDPARGDSYHFEGRRTAIPNLTIYTPVKDENGREGSTKPPPASGGWKKAIVPGMAIVGAAATIGGLFFPPLLFLGGLLLGAWAALKLLSRD